MQYNNKSSSKFFRALFYFFLVLISIIQLGFYIFSDVEEGSITVSFYEIAYEDGSLVALVRNDQIDNDLTWAGRNVRDGRPIEFKNIKRAHDVTPLDYIEYTVVIWTNPTGSGGQNAEKQILYKSPEFTLSHFGYLNDITNSIESQENNEGGQESTNSNSASPDEATPNPAEVQRGVKSISKRPENEKHYWLFIVLATVLVFLTRGFYSLAFQVRRTPNWLIALSEAIFFCIIALIIEDDFDLSRLSPTLSDWITQFLNSLFFQITSAGVIGVVLLSLVAEVFKTLWNGIKNHASHKENAWRDFNNHRLSLLSHSRFLRRWKNENRLFISNSVFLRLIIWFVVSAGTLVLLILLKKDSQMLTGSLYVYLFGVTIGVAGFALHLMATQSSILRAEFRYLRLKQSHRFFDRYPSAAADYYQVLANLFIGSTPIRSEEVAYHKLDICTGVLNSRFGKTQIASNLVNAYDDTVNNFLTDSPSETSRSEHILASRIYEMLTGELDADRCTLPQYMIRTACKCMFDDENVKNNWRNLLSGSKTTLEQVRSVALLEFFRRINESSVFGEIDACPLKWKCGKCNCVQSSQDTAQPSKMTICERLRMIPKLLRRILKLLVQIPKLLVQIPKLPRRIHNLLQSKTKSTGSPQPPLRKLQPTVTYAALLIEFPYILALSIKKKFSEKTPLISFDEMRVIVENYFFNLFIYEESSNWHQFTDEECATIAADVERFFECIGEEPPWNSHGRYLNRILPNQGNLEDDCIEIEYLVDCHSGFPGNYCPNLSRGGWPSLSSDNKYDGKRAEYLRRLSPKAWADTPFKRLSQILFLYYQN